MKINIAQTLRTLLAVTIMASTSVMVNARQLTAAEAANNAMNGTPGGVSIKSAGRLELVHTESLDQLNTIYVMRNADNNQVMLLSADDVAVPILGILDNGDFDPNNMPPQMAEWLKEYSREIAAATKAGLPTLIQPQSMDLGYVAPLLASQWNQGDPYNLLCPSDDGGLCVTGCVATAMAQVMRHHRWPSRAGTGTKTYTWNGQDLTIDFATTPFNWNQMQDTYGSSSTAAQKNAVATLMKACGYSVEMGYSSSASGAYSENVGPALVNYFGYAKDIVLAYRDYYPLREWIPMLYNELANNRPIYYAGAGTGAHAFVLDGYRSGDLFHVNWGWGGTSNGYFVISALDPASQGIGGSTAGYNYQQSALLGVRKDYDGSDYRREFVHANSYEPNLYEYNSTTSTLISLTIPSTNYFVRNTSLVSVPVSFGLKLTDVESGEVKYAFSSSEQSLSAGYWRSTVYVYTSAMPETGTYDVEIAAKSDGEIYDVHHNVAPFKLRVTCDAANKRWVFTKIESNASLAVSGLKKLYNCYQGKYLEVQATYTASGDEFFGDVYPTLYNGANAVAQLDAIRLNLPAGETKTIASTFKMPDELATGSYTLYMLDGEGKRLSSPLTVSVLTAPTTEATPTLSSVAIENIGGQGTTSSPYQISPDAANITIGITTTDGYFDAGVYAMVPSTDGYMYNHGGVSTSFGPNENRTYTFSLTRKSDESTGSANKYRVYLLYYRDGWNYFSANGGPYYYVYDELAGIEDVTADAERPDIAVMGRTLGIFAPSEIAHVEVYNAMGALVVNIPVHATTANVTVPDGSTGLYIVRLVMADGSTHTSKLSLR